MNFEADNTIMVGNSYEKDILPASKMGIKTILYDPKRKYKKNPGADFIIIDLIEIVENVWLKFQCLFLNVCFPLVIYNILFLNQR